ncbi:MAG: hypothetical protein H0W72_12440, partial [Planctomycetes bacterium]|nr:hypothetical protein [Planctomycetota bacterium]
MSSPAGTRLEHDAMGPVEVPAARLYGASTARAVANFPFASGPLPRPVILAMARIKQAAARANQCLGLLDAERAALIQRASQDILDGAIGMEEFPVDVFQTGSGTSSNMNVNEVVANRCAQLARRPIGAKDPVHPNDHVNRCQSSNDVFPSAIHLAVLERLDAELAPALALLAGELTVKATTWSAVLKIGRTHLQDATVVSIGQECGGWAAQAAQSRDRLLIA